MTRLLRVVVAATLLVLLAACDVDVGVGIDVAPDGSGTVAVDVRFDEEAVQTVGELEDLLSFDDAEASGWDITVERIEAEGAVISAIKVVTGPGAWQPTLDEILGPGVFNEVRVVADEDGGQTLAFELDLRDGWDLFTDDELTEVLGGEPFGAPIEELTGRRDIDEIVDVELGVSVRNLEEGVPTTESFQPRFDDDEPLRVNLAATEANSTADLLRWISWSLFFLAALATILAITGVVLQRRSDRLRPAPTPASLASRVPGRASAEAVGAATAAGEPVRPRDSVRLVVIEPLSVLYGQARVLDDVVLPFVRAQGGTARADTVEEGFRSLLAGSTDTASFWELCGVDGDPDELDGELVAGRSMHSGVRSFFAEMQRRRIPVAATTDDAAEWSSRMRERDRLSTVWPWLVSADVGARRTNVGMFEVLRRESSIAHSHCLYVDSDLDALDAARELGMKTALFDPGDLELPAVVGHPVITDLKSLFGKG